MQWVPFWPKTASNTADVVNALYIAELAVCGAILLLVFGLMITFCLRYRRGSPAPRGHQVQKTWIWEIGWTTATLAAFLALFVWGANAYVWLYDTPRGDLELYVVGKQWMWKVQHPGGQREIDAMHLPLGKTVRVVLTSQDVIHSFFVPAFRVKRDAVPGTYQTFWFKPNQTGEFALKCSEFCGTEHAHMTGKVIVMAPGDYAHWLSEQGVHESLAEQGEALFRKHGCSGCHGANSAVHAPSLVGVYGSVVHLQGGDTVVADERYIRDSILLPDSQIVAGYAPIMPSFAGQIGEDDLMKLVAYIQSLGRQGRAP